MSELKNYSFRLYMSFPGANTPICDTELEALAREQVFLDAVGVHLVLGTPDSADIIQAWGSSKGLSIDFGVKPHRDPARETSLVELPSGNILYWSEVDNKIGRSVKEIIRIIEAALLDEPCPEGWTPGNISLKDKFNESK